MLALIEFSLQFESLKATKGQGYYGQPYSRLY